MVPVRGDVLFIFPCTVLVEKSSPRTGEKLMLPFLEGLSSGGSSLALLRAQETASDTA